MNTNELKYVLKESEREITQLRQRNAILEAKAEEWETMRILATQMERNHSHGLNRCMNDALRGISHLLDQIDRSESEEPAFETPEDKSTGTGMNTCCSERL